ncbi:hypothetical protein PTKIN_Ptkin08bG0165700 [Pterospermum kingtungense]
MASCSKLLSCLCMDGDNVKALMLFDKIHRKIKLRSPSSPGETQNKDKSIMIASTFWSEMKCKGVEPDVVCYTVLIDQYCRTNNLQDAIRIFDEMIDTGLEPDNVTYTALISGYCRRGYVEKAVTLVDEMSSRGIQPDSHTISTLEHYGILKAMRIMRRKELCGSSG